MSPAATQAPNAVVVGMGRTGLSVARHLHRSGFRIAVTDSRATPPELEGVRALGPQVVTRTGGFDPLLLERADIVVTSPGVPLDDPFFVQARARGLDIVGDIELFARAADAPVVGITGTNGKSTVTTLLGRMAERAGVRVRVGGNLGQPALDLLDRGPTDLYVLELSSFQLDTTHSLRLKASVVLNVTADHMDRYATLKAYAASKARIYANSETAVVNADEPMVVGMPRAGQRVLSFSLVDEKADFSLKTPAVVKARGWRVAALHCCRSPRCASRAVTTPPTRSRRWHWVMRCACRSRPCSMNCASSPACRTARSGSPRSRACVTSTIRRAPMSVPRWRRSVASWVRWW
jgi:UDP-N-acetylmuramoylalanine--D-glutamate ligase